VLGPSSSWVIGLAEVHACMRETQADIERSKQLMPISTLLTLYCYFSVQLLWLQNTAMGKR
jgi:hypothetical protein